MASMTIDRLIRAVTSKDIAKLRERLNRSVDICNMHNVTDEPLRLISRRFDISLTVGDLRELRDILIASEAEVERLDGENNELRLAICGGEDAPGYAASIPLASIIKVVEGNYALWRDANDRAEKAEAELTALRAQVEELKQALRSIGWTQVWESNSRPNEGRLAAIARQALQPQPKA